MWFWILSYVGINLGLYFTVRVDVGISSASIILLGSIIQYFDLDLSLPASWKFRIFRKSRLGMDVTEDLADRLAFVLARVTGIRRGVATQVILVAISILLQIILH